MADPEPSPADPVPPPADLVPPVLARGTRGAVAAPHHLASQAGLGVLAAGGSAVDAAIATNAVLAVVMPNACGLGGDAFWLIWDPADRRVVGLNGSGHAPAGADPETLRAAGLTRMPRRGPWSVTVPGAVGSWGEAHRRWGRLSRSAVLADAVELAAGGFPAWPGLIDGIETTVAIADRTLGQDNGFRHLFRPLGRPWRPGERIRQPALAATLERLATDGFEAFYAGELGARQAAVLASTGGPHTAADFAAERPTWTDPIAVRYRDARVVTHPPNSAGVVGLQLLGILERFEPPRASAFGPSGWSDDRWIHVGIEAAKLAAAERDRWVGDPDRSPVDVDELLGPVRLDALAARIDRERADPEPSPCATLVGGTVYLAAVDAGGLVVSLIESHAAGFGSTVADPVTGIHYHSRGGSFSLEPGHRNELAPGRRPLHSLLPAMTFHAAASDAGPSVVHGSMGGDVQPQILAQVVSALVDGGASVERAVAAPRWSVGPDGPDGGPPTDVAVEDRISPATIAGLERRGHRVRRVAAFDRAMGHAHAIELVEGGPAEGGSLAAATDPRSIGLPAVR